jgi:hypothetical protein
MKKVIIEKEKLRKCVILEKDGEYVFRSGYGEFHEDVANRFRELEPELKDWRIRGGGRVLWVGNTIRVYGKNLFQSSPKKMMWNLPTIQVLDINFYYDEQ